MLAHMLQLCTKAEVATSFLFLLLNFDLDIDQLSNKDMAKAGTGSGGSRPRVTAKDRKSNLDSSRACTMTKAKEFEVETKAAVMIRGRSLKRGV